jgi:CCR4-NOT transcription complex subunit 3
LRLQQEQLRQQHQAQQQQAAQAAQQQQQQQMQQSQGQGQNQQQQQQTAPGSGSGGQQQDANSVTSGIDIISGLNGLGITDAGSVGSSHKRNMSSSGASVDTGSSLLGNNSNNISNTNNNANGVGGVNTINNGILQESFATLPQSNEHDRTNIRSNSYTPQNPYPATPASYPTTPNAIFENPAIFEKLGTDALFYIFYYKQGSYQQYLAARELKKQSWRFHKKYMTWFQRHEEPKVTTDEYEQGTYVYFDWETGWCTRIKQDFRFEYSFLEDTLQ